MDNKHFKSQHDEQLKDCPYFYPNTYIDTEAQAELYMSVDTGDLPRIKDLILRYDVPPIIDQNVLCAFFTMVITAKAPSICCNSYLSAIPARKDAFVTSWTREPPCIKFHLLYGH